MRRVDEVVPPAVVLLPPVVLDDIPDPRPLRVPDDQPRPGLVVYRKQVQLAAERAMVAPAGLLQPVQVLFQRLVRLECGAVDALQPVPVLVAAPVGAGHAEQLERRYPARRLDVGAAAQVLEVAVAIRGDRLVLGDAFDDLQLEVVVGVHRPGVVSRVLAVLEGQVARDHLGHAPLDLLQVVVGERARRQEVVVEAVVGGRAEGELYVGEHSRRHVGHHVGRGVANPLSQLYKV